MKKIKAHIKTSPDKDLTYNIYRSVNDEALPATIDLLTAKVPVMVVKESEIPTSAMLIFEEENTMDVTAILESSMIPYTIKHAVLRDMLHHVIVKIDYNDSTSKYFTIEFDNGHNIVSVKDQDGTEYDASESAIIDTPTVIKVHETLLQNSVKVSTSYYTEVFEVVDMDAAQPGVTYNGPSALGINPATLNKDQSEIKPTVVVTVPYFKFKPVLDMNPITYNYRILAKDAANNLSDPSDLISVSMAQSSGTVKYTLQHCKYNSTLSIAEQNWVNTDIVLSQDTEFEFGKEGTENYTKYGSIFGSNIIPGIQTSSISATYTNDTTPAVTLKCDNPWQISAYTDRETKMFRAKGEIIGEPGKFIYSANTITNQILKVGIDKVIIRRKEVLDPLTDNTPAAFDGADADTVATYIKFDGLKYMELNDTDPTVLDASTLDTAMFQAPTVYSLITDASGKTELTLIDTNVVNGKLYRYTIYIVDDMGITSTGASYDVTCV